MERRRDQNIHRFHLQSNGSYITDCVLATRQAIHSAQSTSRGELHLSEVRRCPLLLKSAVPFVQKEFIMENLS
jgi:hypothetical protein